MLVQRLMPMERKVKSERDLSERESTYKDEQHHCGEREEKAWQSCSCTHLES